MVLLHFPTPSEGVLSLLVTNTVLSVSLLKNIVRFVLHVVGCQTHDSTNSEEVPGENISRRRISITQLKSLCQNRKEERRCSDRSGSSNSRSRCSNSESGVECCVCLCRFEAEAEVSELMSCKHFFHRGCLDKWFGNKHTTCPLCRSIL